MRTNCNLVKTITVTITFKISIWFISSVKAEDPVHNISVDKHYNNTHKHTHHSRISCFIQRFVFMFVELLRALHTNSQATVRKVMAYLCFWMFVTRLWLFYELEIYWYDGKHTQEVRPHWDDMVQSCARLWLNSVYMWSYDELLPASHTAYTEVNKNMFFFLPYCDSKNSWAILSFMRSFSRNCLWFSLWLCFVCTIYQLHLQCGYIFIYIEKDLFFMRHPFPKKDVG